MKDLYSQLAIPAYTRDYDRIRDAIHNSVCDGSTKEAAELILLDDKRREIYDSTHRVVSCIGTMRSNLGLTRSQMWDSEAHRDFERPNRTGRELDHLQFREPESPRTSSRRAHRQTRRGAKPTAPHKSSVVDAFLNKHKVIILSVITVGVAALLFSYFHPWPQYEYASYVDTPKSYREFLARFSSSRYAESAKNRKLELEDELAWDRVLRFGTPLDYREYLSDFAEGAFADRAREEYQHMQDIAWQESIASRQASQMEQFLADYPDAGKNAEAAFVIERWNRDWRWVREQDRIEHYERFLKLEPSHPQAEEARERIVDLEVQQIAAGDYGSLPPATPIQSNAFGTTTKIHVHNDTAHTLTLRYSGPTSRRYVFAPQATKFVSLDVGAYEVAASVDAAGVQNYYGQEKLSGGSYEVTYYIETSFLPGYRRR